MVYLDCQDVDSTVRSLATASELPAHLLVEKMPSFEVDWVELAPADVDPLVVAPRDYFQLLGVDIGDLRFEGTYYFHGTRVIDPDSFRRDGILPLGRMIDRLWETLYELIRDDVTEEQWRRCRADLEAGGGDHDGWLYRTKVDNPVHHGPYAMLVRDHLLNPRATHSHDYLATPEIVEDIARACGFGLQARFDAAATSCTVKFRINDTRDVDVEAAFWYAYTMTRGEGIGMASLAGIDLGGCPVPAADILAVDS
ncbi:hypothetical protein ABIA31_007980 [Catenulispora sp. MAP5-51]|uniref:hypothetical protein n=1 Tax=Catenulispora sp. MAP5-51 TaxID=3156298 RepID=UPI0035176639